MPFQTLIILLTLVIAAAGLTVWALSHFALSTAAVFLIPLALVLAALLRRLGRG